jgi:RNA polymerase sigma-70 factor, ECF subfamily
MHSTSASLMERLGRNDEPAAWGRFVELYTPLLYRWCRQLGLSDTDAADLIQDVFVILVDQLPRFRYDPSLSFRAWMKTILLNVWRKHWRKVARAPKSDRDAEDVADREASRLLEESEHRDYLVGRALQIAKVDFEPATWKACWEFVMRERPAADVAAELGISVNAVYLAKSRVLRHLRSELAGLME